MEDNNKTVIREMKSMAVEKEIRTGSAHTTGIASFYSASFF